MSFQCVGKIVSGLLALGVLAGPVAAQTAASPDSIRPPRAFDPGPRPVGNQFIAPKGAILNTGVVDSIQPKDADGNGAGRQLPVLTADQTAFWFGSLAVFGQQATVDGSSDPATTNPTLLGLGPVFNGTSCGMCHAYPALGGSSPVKNPQVALATAMGGQNAVPSFITPNGPVRVARFVNAN
ncbi:MAG TPA: hypothetical protein VGC34_03955, partial [Steroidobacteraceae bacterium]